MLGKTGHLASQSFVLQLLSTSSRITTFCWLFDRLKNLQSKCSLKSILNRYRYVSGFVSYEFANMFLRSILYPSLIACVVGVPMLYSSNWHQQAGNRNQQVGYRPPVSTGIFGNRSTNQSFGQSQRVNSIPVSSQPLPPRNPQTVNVIAPTPAPLERSPAAPVSLQLPQFASANPQGTPVADPTTSGTMQLPNATTLPPSMVVAGPIVSGPIVSGPIAGGQIINGSTTSNLLLPGMTPDFGAAETFVFPGDANGPDLTAQPTDFIPVTNFAEIIRFDVYPNWVKSRWKRVSTNPGDAGLHGLRVPVVTGTNTWDLHGSLTYYFDVNQRAQRITFRGWTGDSSRLVNLLTSQFGLKAQPTHWAGAYAAQNSRGVPTAGLLMQHPAVITRENPVQQVAMVMELNHPQGSFQLSQSFMNMLRYAVANQ